MTRKQRTLVLFDIDGTLVSSGGSNVDHWKNRMVQMFKEVFGKDLPPDFGIDRVNGKLERRYFREFATDLGVPDDVFFEKFPAATEYFHRLLAETMDRGEIQYDAIPDAVQLVSRLRNTDHAALGLITGNVEKNAWLKLKGSAYEGVFPVGAFGDEVEDRGELVKAAHGRAQTHFGEQFAIQETVVIGDTVHDIVAARDAGTRSVGVATGLTDTLDQLVEAGADVAVSSLMDEKVLKLLRLS